MLDYKQLLAFVKVVEGHSFTQAAKALYMTQPAISWQIKALEQDLDLQLLERRERHVQLTEAGRLFYTHARRLVRQYEQMLNEMEQFKGMERGKLLLGASTLPGEYILPAFIGAFKKQHPGADIVLQIADSEAVVELLLNDEVHLGVIGAKIKEPKLELQPFYQDELILVAAPSHPLAAKDNIKAADLKGQAYIMRETGSGTQMVIREKLKSKGMALEDLDVAMELGTTRAVITAVEAGLGLSWVSRWAVQEALQLGYVKQLPLDDFTIPRELYLVFNSRKVLSPLVAAFRNFLLDAETRRKVWK